MLSLHRAKSHFLLLSTPLLGARNVLLIVWDGGGHHESFMKGLVMKQFMTLAFTIVFFLGLFGAKGEKGDRGDRGEKGDRGPIGSKGESGISSSSRGGARGEKVWTFFRIFDFRAEGNLA